MTKQFDPFFGDLWRKYVLHYVVHVTIKDMTSTFVNQDLNMVESIRTQKITGRWQIEDLVNFPEKKN